ncbi:MAG: hypothetical protein VR69_16110 [Peptococcaceae bacterium BRH_c4b]|nr:MAG: hypothetical protein VR69_16110 [Peptococcaceae bacterium BRH_c4b]
MKNFYIEEGEGKHKVFLWAVATGDGILVNILGGEKPHLGAVVVSLPRPGLADPSVTSCTTSVLPLPGHKDDEAARPVAELLAKVTGQPVSVAVGMHIHEAKKEDIDKLLHNTRVAADRLLKLLDIE